jgi:hypothetical protein
MRKGISRIRIRTENFTCRINRPSLVPKESVVSKLVLIATLVAASASRVFAQGAQPAQHRGVVDTLLEQGDTLRCAVMRDDIPDEMLLSGCSQGPPRVGGL